MPKKTRTPPLLKSSFYASKPISVWNRTFQVDFKGLFGVLAKGSLHGFTGQWTELGSDAVDALAALGIDSRDAPQLAWLLVRRALLLAMTELIRETENIRKLSESDIEDLSAQLDELLGQKEIAIDRSLFEAPRDLPLLAALQGPFARWLEAYGLEPPAAESITCRLSSYFVLALHVEWRSGASVYENIRGAVDTPFTKAAERDRAWGLYLARLERQVDEPMFGEAFGLRQVYVPLRAAYIVENSDEQPVRQSEGLDIPLERTGGLGVAVDLEKEIDAWLVSGNRWDAYRVVSGGPGSGKSSFARMLAAKIVRRGMRVVLIPLHQLSEANSLFAAVGEYVRLGGVLPVNPLDPELGEDRLLLILDGLDEVSFRGRVGTEAAQDFIHETFRTIEIRNQETRRLLGLFTGREPAIQTAGKSLLEQRRVLHILPYMHKQGENGFWITNSEILKHDQRQDWWSLYAKASGKRVHSDELKGGELDELTPHPLFNYLITLGYTSDKSLPEKRILTVNQIYHDLLEAVHGRAYEHRRQHLSIRGIELDEFARILEEIALCAWHGKGRTVGMKMVEQYCQKADIFHFLDQFKGARSGLVRILTAFYFRQLGSSIGTTDPLFEFTHRSFRDYLTARRIVRGLEEICNGLNRRQEESGSGEHEALLYWAEICGPSRMDWDLWMFVYREIMLRGQALALGWQKTLCRLTSVALRSGLPFELMATRLSYREEMRWARNAEESLLVVLNACAWVTREVSKIEWPELDGEGSSRTTFGTWLRRLQGQRLGQDNMLAFYCISFLDLSGVSLDYGDLRGAGLQRSVLKGASLEGVYLNGANLAGADLNGANLRRASFKGANLQNASLENAILSEANLEGAKLLGTRIDGANIQGALISELELSRARGKPTGKPILNE